jgi:hypothetical protein
MAETLASFFLATAGILSTAAFRGGGNGWSWCGWEMAMGTLLGPEGTTSVVVSVTCLGLLVGAWKSARHGLAPYTAGCYRVWCGVDRVVGWSFVENCTVDASIFVVKLSRANGECLGTRSR